MQGHRICSMVLVTSEGYSQNNDDDDVGDTSNNNNNNSRHDRLHAYVLCAIGTCDNKLGIFIINVLVACSPAEVRLFAKTRSPLQFVERRLKFRNFSWDPRLRFVRYFAQVVYSMLGFKATCLDL